VLEKRKSHHFFILKKTQKNVRTVERPLSLLDLRLYIETLLFINQN